MNRRDIERLLVEAHSVTQHRDFVIMGSLSVLGIRAGLAAGVLSLPTIEYRMREETTMESGEQARAKQALDEDWSAFELTHDEDG